jgi:hypothetical protein
MDAIENRKLIKINPMNQYPQAIPLDDGVSIPIKCLPNTGQIIIEISDRLILQNIKYLSIPGDRKVPIIRDKTKIKDIPSGEFFAYLIANRLELKCQNQGNINALLSKRTGHRLILLFD